MAGCLPPASGHSGAQPQIAAGTGRATALHAFQAIRGAAVPGPGARDRGPPPEDVDANGVPCTAGALLHSGPLQMRPPPRLFHGHDGAPDGSATELTDGAQQVVVRAGGWAAALTCGDCTEALGCLRRAVVRSTSGELAIVMVLERRRAEWAWPGRCTTKGGTLGGGRRRALGPPRAAEQPPAPRMG